MDPTSVSAAAVVVTVVLFAIAQYLSARSVRKTSQALLMDQVLSALERVARTYSRPIFTRLWSKPELEYTLLVPRLLVGLRRRDRIIAVWVRCKVDDMLAASTQGEVIKVASETSGKIAEWQLGERRRGWFASEVRRHRKGRNQTRKRDLHTASTATALTLIAILVAIAPSLLGEIAVRAWRSRTR